MKKTVFIIAVIIMFSITINGQIVKNDSPFFGGMAGALSSGQSDGRTQSGLSFVFGGSVGIPVPLIKNLFLYARTSYSSYSNFQSYYNTAYMNNTVQLSDDFVEVNSSFSQLILNGGLLYNFLITEELVLGITGGLTFMVVNQEARLRTGRVISSVDNENIWGAFGGIIAEKRWDESNFSTFVEAQYNYAESDAVYRPGALSTMNYTIGVRYYLTGK
jgi:hypothetical protein